MIRSTKLSKGPWLLSHTGDVKKSFFPFKLGFCIYSAGALLLGSKILLGVVIRVSVPNNNRWTTRSYTADFCVITHKKEDHYISFERGESSDHTYEKICSFECKTVKWRLKQDEAKFLRCY